MLDRSKVLRELKELSDKLFLDISAEQEIAYQAWQTVVADPLFQQKIKAAHLPWIMPTWQDSLETVVSVPPYEQPYQVLSVDGSQIYPDKHQGTSCFLLNIGSVVLRYGAGPGIMQFSSEPFVFIEQDFEGELSSAVDIVNCKREEFELARGVYDARALKKEFPNVPLLFLFDGSLIFWHLESKDPLLKNYFLKKYQELLESFYQEHIVPVGYISLPKSKELINLIRAQLSGFSSSGIELADKVHTLSDSTVARFFLEPGQRSIVFQNHAPISHLYAPHLKPHFFYYHAGSEIARIELPAYGTDKHCVDLLTSLIANQIEKGNGYPVALAEAHEQAVVKGADREFFYQVIGKLSVEQKRRLIPSQKSAKKRRMNV